MWAGPVVSDTRKRANKRHVLIEEDARVETGATRTQQPRTRRVLRIAPPLLPILVGEASGRHALAIGRAEIVHEVVKVL